MLNSFSFTTNQTEFNADLLEVAHLFFTEMPSEDGEVKISSNFSVSNSGALLCEIEINEKKYRCEYNLTASASDKILYKRYFKRYIKLSLYNALSDFLNISSPWGSLTGIRPTKLWYDLQKEGHQNPKGVFRDIFMVAPEKTELVKTIIDTQKNIISYDSDVVDLYIGIPFCVSRCRYCSFSSGLISKYSKYTEDYVSTLISELRAANEIINAKYKKLRAVYIGGGTPSSLPPVALGRILEALPQGKYELTVEAGRPDGIMEELLDVLKDRAVTRISLNPQTLNNVTLQKVGRNHTAEDFLEKFELAKKYDFVINSDLIAALPDETAEDFRYSLDSLIKLSPDNITVHTLALKRGAEMLEQKAKHTDEAIVKEMVEYSQYALKNIGYLPYYLYRQKYMAGNFENVGFARRGTECVYNVDMMEETTNILACGAGAISKRVFFDTDGGTRIERAPNVKDIITYLQRSKDMIERKKKLFSEDK